MDERGIILLLARAPGLTAQHVRAALPQSRDLTTVVERLRAIGPALPARTRAYLDAPSVSRLDADRCWLDTCGAVLVPCTSPLYPPLLADAPGAPPVLFVLGDVRSLGERHVALVGARRATPAGCAIARDLAGDLARAGLGVASGLALGIDAASHEGALDAGATTLAVCAHGLDCVYPRQHAGLACRIRDQGALISCFPPGTPPTRRRFPWRNRILSGLAAATVVVEAARDSGSLHTARSAERQGRLVFAVPGSVRSPLSAGCHDLLRRGARIAESSADVLRALKIPSTIQVLMGSRASSSLAGPLDTDYKILLDAVGFEPVSLNTLVERTGLQGSGIASMLLILELGGRVAPRPGGRWSRVS
ncbi:MAG: DNA-processing protein DprA [Steroidobacteraceae bacterium]